MENRKRTEALNKLELVLAKEHELKTIGVHAAAAAHSLSTPLSTIKLVSKELEKEIGSNNKYSKDIKLLHSQALRCGEILKKLSMTPLKRDEFLENVKLIDLLAEITNSFKEISNKKFSVKSENNNYDPLIKRKVEITYGLRNFIGNASKFSDSLIEVKLESNKYMTKIEICDDGPGFPEDIKKFLGEPYIHSKDKKIDSNYNYRMIIAHANCKDKGQNLERHILGKFPNILSNYLLELGGGLGAHAGPGSLVIGIQKMDLE